MKKKKILVVEDDKDTALSIEFSLGQEGFECVVAHDGETALDKVKTFPPDLIILDLKLGKVSGYEVCEALKGNRDLKNIPIIMLTAMGSEVWKLSGVMAGASAYMTKPFEMEKLIQKIKNALENQEVGDKMSKDFWEKMEILKVKRKH